MILAVLSLLASMSSADAISTLLNSRHATSADVYEEARAIVEEEAAEGRPLQQFIVGVTTTNRVLSVRYLAASRKKIKALAELTNNPMAWYLLSIDSNDFGALRKAANGGNVQALNAQGTICTEEALSQKQLKQEDKDRLLARSFACFRQAADLGDANGLINLGACYLSGYGCRASKELAFLYFKAAARAGHPEGMDNVAGCYRYGDGVEQDNEQYLLWKMRGRAARGDAAAAKWLKEQDENSDDR